MEIEYDKDKNKRNVAERGLSFDLVAEIYWSGAFIVEDTRNDYPETRFVALGEIKTTLFTVCYIKCTGAIRVISFRKASKRERRIYYGD